MKRQENNLRRELSKYDLMLHKRHGKDQYIICDVYTGLLVAPSPYYGEFSEMTLQEVVAWVEYFSE